MLKLYDIIERHGFVGVQDVDKIYDLTARKLEKLNDELYTYIYSCQNQRIWDDRADQAVDTFSFHASASIRGASGCSELQCRLRKLDFLGRYGALYANELTNYPSFYVSSG